MKNLTATLAAAACLAACGGSNRTLELTQPSVVSFLSMIYVDGAGQGVSDTTADNVVVHKLTSTGTISISAPDGHAVTFGELKRAGGTVSLECRGDGTRAVVSAQHLLPNATYTLWLDLFEMPGVLKAGLGALVGETPVGKLDGSQSVMQTDATGAGHLEALIPAAAAVTQVQEGKMSAVPKCLLDAFEVHVIAVYHLDGAAHGGMSGGDSKIAEHVDWAILNGMPELF